MASNSNMSPVAKDVVTFHTDGRDHTLNEGFRQELGRGGCTCLGPCKCDLASGFKDEGFRREFGREGQCKCSGRCTCGLGSTFRDEGFRKEFGREGWKDESFNKKELGRESTCKCIGICTCGKGSTFQSLGAEQCKCVGPCTCMTAGLTKGTKAMEHASFPNELGREGQCKCSGPCTCGLGSGFSRGIGHEGNLLGRENHLGHHDDHLGREGYHAQDHIAREGHLGQESHFLGREGQLGEANLAREGLIRPVGHDAVNTGLNQVCSCEKEPCTCTRGYTRGPTLAGVTSGTEHMNPILGDAGVAKDHTLGKKKCKCDGPCTCDANSGLVITKHEGFMRGAEHNPALGGGIIRQKEYDPAKDGKELGRECKCVGPCTCGLGAGFRKQELHSTTVTHHADHDKRDLAHEDFQRGADGRKLGVGGGLSKLPDVDAYNYLEKGGFTGEDYLNAKAQGFHTEEYEKARQPTFKEKVKAAKYKLEDKARRGERHEAANALNEHVKSLQEEQQEMRHHELDRDVMGYAPKASSHLGYCEHHHCHEYNPCPVHGTSVHADQDLTKEKEGVGLKAKVKDAIHKITGKSHTNQNEGQVVHGNEKLSKE